MKVVYKEENKKNNFNEYWGISINRENTKM